MALLRLAALHLRAPLVAATVDHGLRAQSADEAEQVARWCADLRISHHILVWDGAKPLSRIQERAREARYRLLADCAKAAGCDVLMTAHHADDQAETILFRLMRGSGLSGLAGMAAVVERHGVRHARPLLDWRKDDLIRVCRDAGQAYVDDPSNRDPRFARTRMRALSEELAREGLDAPALERFARRMRQADAALDATAAATLADLRLSGDDEGVSLDGARLAAQPDEIALRILRIEIVGLGREPRLERLERIASGLLGALRSAKPFTGTIGGCLLRALANGRVTIRREKARRAHELNHS
jgi:tRNA(Ile)-lysidine synthase